MANISRHYTSAPPPPPDEDYWQALLAQDEESSDETASAEETNWSDADAFQKIPLKAPDAYYGDTEDWMKAEQTLNNDMTVMLDVVGYNKGGLLVEWNSLRGFVPASQLVSLESENSHNLDQFIGKRLPLRVIEVSQTQNRLILSERAAQVMSGTRANVLQSLEAGKYCRGVVTNVCDFGAFVDLGGVEGLIHISELSWGRIEHPSEILKRGQMVEIYIMEVWPDEGRIALSLKRLHPDPWQTVEDRYEVGQLVQGIITSVVNFGAFAALEEGLEGLIHISELAEGHFLHPRNVVREGDTVTVRILNINNHARRIGLSLRSVNSP